MLRRVLVIFAALVAVLAIFIASRPSTYRVERATRIDAPPDVVFALVNDFHRWDTWSPWAKLDPGMKTTYGGPPAGVGATYDWAGNGKVGEGGMRIVESRPPEKVGIRLEFRKPMAGVNDTEFTLAPAGPGTSVRWSMKGTNDFVGKAFALVADLDGMIGKDFDRGLGQLKTVAESEARARAGATSASAVAPGPVTPAGGTEAARPPSAPPAQ